MLITDNLRRIIEAMRNPHRHRELVVTVLVAEHELGAGVCVLEELLHAGSEPIEEAIAERDSQDEDGEQRLQEHAARDDPHIDLNNAQRTRLIVADFTRYESKSTLFGALQWPYPQWLQWLLPSVHCVHSY